MHEFCPPPADYWDCRSIKDAQFMYNFIRSHSSTSFHDALLNMRSLQTSSCMTGDIRDMMRRRKGETKERVVELLSVAYHPYYRV